MVHRLDKDTSGVMVLAKNEDAYEKLKLQFLERKTKKTYWAMVHGKMSEPSGIISAPIDRHPKDTHKFAVSENFSRTAITEWKVLKEFPEHSLLELSPHTGELINFVFTCSISITQLFRTPSMAFANLSRTI